MRMDNIDQYGQETNENRCRWWLRAGSMLLALKRHFISTAHYMYNKDKTTF